MSLDHGRSIVGYVIAGILLSLFIGLISYGIAFFAKYMSSILSSTYEIGVNTTSNNNNITYTTIHAGNETIQLPKPRNPALSTITDLVFKILDVVINTLTHPVTLAVLIAITLIVYAIVEKRGTSISI